MFPRASRYTPPVIPVFIPAFLLGVFAAFFCFVTLAVAQVDSLPSPTASVAASPSVFIASKTHAVPLGDAQNSQNRLFALYNRKKLERMDWGNWDSAPAPIKAFLAARDPATAAAYKPKSGVFFNVYDLDGDGKDDLILRFGTRLVCTDTPTGCAYAVYYADLAKKRVLYHARKLLPNKGGVSLNNVFYAFLPQGGEDITALSYKMFMDNYPMQSETQRISAQLEKVFPAFYKLVGNMPTFSYAKYDLNKDGIPEYIVQITEDDEQMDLCDPKDGALCPVLIYADQGPDRPLRLLGNFFSLQNIAVARTASPGYADVITTTNDAVKGRTVVYTMNPGTGSYELDK